MILIKKNRGAGRYQFEAALAISDMELGSSPLSVLVGIGPTKQEAIDDLKEVVVALVERLNSIDYTKTIE
jgi:hypothetical protein